MKYFSSLICISLLLSISIYSFAQEEEYELLHFPPPGFVQGIVSFSPDGGTNVSVTDNSFSYDKDTIFCGQTYSRFSRGFYLRYEEGKIYTFEGCENEDFLLYDFSLEKGDIFESFHHNGWISRRLSVDSTALIELPNGEIRKWMFLTNLDGFGTAAWIDGIGHIIHGMTTGIGDIHGGNSYILCQKDSSGLVYESPIIEEFEQDCDAFACPFVKADFNFEINNLSVQFTNLSRYETDYEWTFGDGSPISQSENPIHHFEESGCYEICLKAYNTCGRENSLCLQIGVGLSEEWASIESDFDFDFFAGGINDAHFIDENTVWMVSLIGIFKSTDGGENWTSISHPPAEEGLRQFQSIHFYDEQVGIITALTNGINNEDIPQVSNILITKDGGESWQKVVIGGGAYFTEGLWTSRNTAYVIGYASNAISSENATPFLKTNNRGLDWELLPFSKDFSGLDIFALNESILFIGGYNRQTETGELRISEYPILGNQLNTIYRVRGIVFLTVNLWMLIQDGLLPTRKFTKLRTGEIAGFCSTILQMWKD